MKVVLVMFKDEERREFPLSKGTTVLGRARECDLRIPTRDTSRRHCEILVGEQHAVVRDLNSSNGTFLNGKRIAEARLKAGDKLTLGPVTFVVQVDGEPAEILPADTAPLLEDADASASSVTALPLDRDDNDMKEAAELDDIELELDDLLLEDDDEDSRSK